MPRYCRSCLNVMEHNPKAYCCDKCGECLEDILHCHDKELNCIPYINDCLEHFFKCKSEDHYDLHDECACKDPGY